MGPAVGGVSPGRGTTTGQTYTSTFTDSNAYSDLAVLDVLTNSFLDGINACYLAYVPATATSGYLYLVDDAGDGGYVRTTADPRPSVHQKASRWRVLGIPAKENADSGGNANGIPGRRRTVIGA